MSDKVIELLENWLAHKKMCDEIVERAVAMGDENFLLMARKLQGSGESWGLMGTEEQVRNACEASTDAHNASANLNTLYEKMRLAGTQRDARYTELYDAEASSMAVDAQDIPMNLTSQELIHNLNMEVMRHLPEVLHADLQWCNHCLDYNRYKEWIVQNERLPNTFAETIPYLELKLGDMPIADKHLRIINNMTGANMAETHQYLMVAYGPTPVCSTTLERECLAHDMIMARLLKSVPSASIPDVTLLHQCVSNSTVADCIANLPQLRLISGLPWWYT